MLTRSRLHLCVFQNGIYTLPSYLSTSVRDLITSMLKVDPLHRITIPEIRSHPWFQLHLPQYLAVEIPQHTQYMNCVCTSAFNF